MTDTTKPTEKEKQENRELAKTIPFDNSGFQIQNLAQATLVADTLINSGLVPAHFNSTAKIIVVAQAAKELNRPIWWGLNNMYVVNGKVGIAAAAVAGLILESGVCIQWVITEEGTFGEENFAIIVISKRKGHEAEVTTKFSIADAKKAGLWNKETWQKYPRQMLTWRAIAFHARLYYSDVLGGSYTAEELDDIAPLPPPANDIPARDDRRLTAQQIEDAQNRKSVKSTEVITAPPVSDKEEVKETDIVNSVGNSYDEVKALYTCAGGKDFTKFAAFVLCRDEDEVDSADKFVAEMLGQIKREIEENGVEAQ